MTTPLVTVPPKVETPPNPPASPPVSPTSPFSGLSPEEKDRLLSQQAQTIRESARKQAEFDLKLKEMSDKVNAPPPPDLTKLNKDFFQAPHTEMQKLIRTELEATVKPLIEFKEQVQGQNEYDRVKNKFKGNPKFKEFIAQPGVEEMIDSAMAGNQPTENAVYGVIAGIKGAMELGDIPKPGGQQPPAGGGRSPSDISVPPHLRPSAPPLPEGKEKVDDKMKARVDAATENERRLAKENHMSIEQYFEFQSLDGMSVPSSKIGVPDKTKKKEGEA